MKAPALSVLALFLSVALFADNSISIQPADPTSNFPVTLFVTQFDSCALPPAVTRSGSSITVTLSSVGICVAPPVLVTWRLPLNVLTAGHYTVTVTPSGSQHSPFAFDVLDANASVVVMPAFSTTAGGTNVRITTSSPFCKPPTTCTAIVTFGGVAATDVRVIDATHLTATTPPHPAGAVEVRVVSSALNPSSFAYRYVDPSAAPLPELYDRLLLPVVYNGPGAQGSNWATEISVRNDNPVPVILRMLQKSVTVSPSTPLRLTLDDAPGGLFVAVPRDLSAGVHFAARSRDTSRDNLDWGTELPVPHEEQFSTSSIELLDIPADSRFRTMLRVFGLHSYETATMTVYAMSDGHTLAARDLVLTTGTQCLSAPYPCDADVPSFALRDLSTPPVAPGVDRIGIRIDPSPYSDSPMWAFVTVTNNDTQHVTVISPQ